MSIRYAKKTDISEIIKLCELHAAFEKAAFDSKNKEKLLIKHLFNTHPTLKCLIIEENEEIVGYATFMKQFSTWDADFYLYLDCLFVREEVRRKGLGVKMMEEIKKHAKFEACKCVQWHTPKFNTKAISFYQKIGATSNTKERFFWMIE